VGVFVNACAGTACCMKLYPPILSEDPFIQMHLRVFSCHIICCQIIIDVELTTLQKQYYRAIFDRNRAFLYKSNNSSGSGGGASAAASGGAPKVKGPQLMNIQMELRKCCNHPFLVEGVEQVTKQRPVKDTLAYDLL